MYSCLEMEWMAASLPRYSLESLGKVMAKSALFLIARELTVTALSEEAKLQRRSVGRRFI